jgi:hypothetical protein
MKQNDQLKKPFFAKFLESQDKDEANKQNPSFLPWPITSKGKDDHDQTMKFPSDGDEEYA